MKKFAGILIVLAVLGAVVSGCSGGAADAEKTAETPAAGGETK